MNVNKTNHSLHWISLYLVDSVIQPLNDQGQYEKDLNMMRSSRSALFPTYLSNFPSAFLRSSWHFLLYYCAASQFFLLHPGSHHLLSQFPPPPCNFKTICCLNKIMICFFGRNLQCMDSIGQLVLFAFTSFAVVGIMSLCKHFNMLLVIYKKGTPLSCQ